MADETESGAPEGQDRPGQQQMVFPTIGDPEKEREQEEAEQGQQQQTEAPELTDMRERMRKLEETREAERREAAERERRMQQTLERLAQQPQQSAQQGAGSSAGSLPQEEQEPELPDPINDPKGYNEALEKKIDIRARRYADQVQNRGQQQSQAQNTANQLWSKLQNDHPELANHDLVVEGVARRELQRLQGSGVDPMQYAASDPDGFVGRIADESRRYLEQVGVPLNKQQEQDPGNGERPDPGGRSRQPAGRTAGIDGGEPQRAGGGGGGQQKGSSFVEELKGMQRNDGFF